eukprot:XP_011683915.1 PREDICTED: glutamic acid-rich protein [Strongylocentrotus purpuratus]
MAYPVISYMNMMNNSQNSDLQKAVLELLIAGYLDRMTVPKFRRKLRQIHSEAVKQAVEEAYEEEADEEEAYEEEADEEEADEEEADEEEAYEEEAYEEEADEEEAYEEEADEEEADEEEAVEEEADPVIEQGEANRGPQPDSQAPVSEHGSVDDSVPQPEPGDASDSQGQQDGAREMQGFGG